MKDAGPVTSEGTCSQPPETGLCRGYFRKYFYNQTSSRCETFVYGGCGGNNNNFATDKDCEAACASKKKFYIWVILEYNCSFILRKLYVHLFFYEKIFKKCTFNNYKCFNMYNY